MDPNSKVAATNQILLAAQAFPTAARNFESDAKELHISFLQSQPAPEGLCWTQLLRRFAKAAFETKRRQISKTEEYDETTKTWTRTNLNAATDVLLSRLTARDFEDIEKRLEPVPQGIKTVSPIARGFRGGHFFALGGFPGIEVFEQVLWSEAPGIDGELAEHLHWMSAPYVPGEVQIPDFPENWKKVVDGYLRAAPARVECGGGWHYIIPPQTM